MKAIYLHLSALSPRLQIVALANSDSVGAIEMSGGR